MCSYVSQPVRTSPAVTMTTPTSYGQVCAERSSRGEQARSAQQDRAVELSDDDIAALIRRSWGGDVAAFNCLVEQYQHRIYALCYRMVGEADAADTTQEVFLSAFCNVRQFRGGSFLAWLLRIARNECYDYLRARKRRSTVSLDSTTDHVDAAPIQLVDPQHSPDDHLVRAEFARELRRTLQEVLKPDQRLVVVLCDIEGYTYEEVVAVTGWALGTVKSRLSRGRARLRVAFHAYAR